MQTDSADYDLEPPPDISTLVHRWIAAFNSHDVERIVELYTEDAELFDTGMKHPRKGQQEISSWFVKRFRRMPTIQYTPLQSFFDEKEGTIQWIARGRIPDLLWQRWLTRPFEVDGISIFRTDHGLISWQHGYYDHIYMAERVFPPLKWLPLKL